MTSSAAVPEPVPGPSSLGPGTPRRRKGYRSGPIPGTRSCERCGGVIDAELTGAHDNDHTRAGRTREALEHAITTLETS